VIASLNNPTTCPHGNPIPGSVASARTYLKDRGAVRLSTLANGEKATILLISEVVEDEEALIHYLHEKGLTPGTQLKVLGFDGEFKGANEGEENFRLQAKEREVYISKAVAAKIWVTR
jgi:DtxR family transcriptional regulator, iron-dependent repressor